MFGNGLFYDSLICDIFGNSIFDKSAKEIQYQDFDGRRWLFLEYPGVKREDLTIKNENGTLKITAVKIVGNQETTLKKNISASPYFDLSKLEAKLEDGILKLSVPIKEDEEVSKLIPIK
jgi:HSP20 family molecular chaperone IbpA